MASFILPELADIKFYHSPPPTTIPELRSKAAAPAPNISPHPLTDIQIPLTNGSCNPSQWSTVHGTWVKDNLNVAMNAAVIYNTKSHLKTEVAN